MVRRLTLVFIVSAGVGTGSAEESVGQDDTRVEFGVAVIPLDLGHYSGHVPRRYRLDGAVRDKAVGVSVDLGVAHKAFIGRAVLEFGQARGERCCLSPGGIRSIRALASAGVGSRRWSLAFEGGLALYHLDSVTWRMPSVGFAAGFRTPIGERPFDFFVELTAHHDFEDVQVSDMRFSLTHTSIFAVRIGGRYRL